MSREYETERGSAEYLQETASGEERNCARDNLKDNSKTKDDK